ncbi:alpha amylase C-terminal domain-containing protein [Halomonas sp. HP20-15]|uniref:alpha amylase C-terminal domain-containing protein n=1 Tax=Halomonas sp. HP20-15 TaxID=3085901 RepID=UPI002982716E|nr:alpha amylase C-terminal domain-containing protein [Halomonas sp. HP20-15]MDW5377669.1 alpha amylase C-terminal domain-containing protein [Halomonas sp. HP20-15]
MVDEPQRLHRPPVQYRWHDEVWLRQRSRDDAATSPVSIYRLDPAAWRLNHQGAPLAWEALAERLVPYVADLGFTHVELAHVDIDTATLGPIFAGFVDACHEGGIGVLPEWRVVAADETALERVLTRIEDYHLDGLHLSTDGEDAACRSRDALIQALIERYPDLLLLADSASAVSSAHVLICATAWPQVTLTYLSEPPEQRGRQHAVLVDSLSRAFDRHWLLPLADADSAEGRDSWLGRMPGDTWQRFANLRAWLGFMWTHPGKKLLGMGAEFAQGRGWQALGTLDWGLLDDPSHAGMLRLVADLNRLYVNEPALHVRDTQPGSFAWVVGDDATNSVIAFLRYGPEGTAPLLAIANFTPRVLTGYRLGVPALGTWYEVLNSDSTFYGGSNVGNAHGVRAQLSSSHGYPASLELTLPPLATLLLRQGDWPA